MQWWCAAVSRPWDWTWRPYPGVWVLVALLAVAYGVALRRTASGPEVDAGASRLRVLAFSGGLLVLWGGLDWPLAALGASYLASAHAAQFVLVGVVAPALLLLGVPERIYRRIPDRPRLLAFLRVATRPVWAFILFNTSMIVTHWPQVTDALMASPAGSFVLDMTWLASGLLFWWPVVAPVPERPGFHPLLRIGYLALNALLIRPPFLMMLFSEYPIYGIYELAPPFPGTDPVSDQQVAATWMKLGTAWVMGAGIFVEFVRWVRSEGGATGPEQPRASEIPPGRRP
ncbi:MAG: hypothetical protein GWM92_15640 [Gemmatimonadetes bacterium]|nr:cytochrome c oxidase assembly protein [Gemmatimonadota bacterium]NIR80164.1 cytochrome c oxidase assembly protein [Gemmatimonadota bacterium]NIT88927.1 cytochrome c oxidase assembly protein [Gemmatimonadota bacterium]NIU32720.1 cytochrome c oxidase assembly protein [Gemmatimonadota bacterium]NIU37155.1 hypothetical protein [Gemmatimonadota bacterium]